MGHVVNPVSFRLGTVKVWNSNFCMDNFSLKNYSYFAAMSINMFYVLCNVFRSRFFIYVTSYIFTNIKVHVVLNRILCMVFLYNGAVDYGGYKMSSLVNFFFSKNFSMFRKLYSHRLSLDTFTNRKSDGFSLFPYKFFFQSFFSYVFFFKMWNKKKVTYRFEIAFLRRYITKKLFFFAKKKNWKFTSFSFKRYSKKFILNMNKIFTHLWKTTSVRIIKNRRKNYRAFLFYFILKRKYICSIDQKWFLPMKKFFYKNIFKLSHLKNFKSVLVLFKNFRLTFILRERLRIYKKKKRKNPNTKYRCVVFPRTFTNRNFIRYPVATLYGFKNRVKTSPFLKHIMFFKFFINKFIKRLKYNVLKVFYFYLLKTFSSINFVFLYLYKNNKLHILFKNIVFLFYLKKLKISKLFKFSLIKFNLYKIKLDLIHTRVLVTTLENILFKKTIFTNKILNFLKKTFKNYVFNFEYHFVPVSEINAKVVSLFITIRLKQHYRINPLTKQLKNYFRLSASRIRGWKIMCAGRFSRKEIASFIVYKGGAFGFSVVNAFLDYHFSKVILKYSVCGIKVWLVLRKQFRYLKVIRYFFYKFVKSKKQQLFLNSSKIIFHSIFSNYKKHFQKKSFETRKLTSFSIYRISRLVFLKNIINFGNIFFLFKPWIGNFWDFWSKIKMLFLFIK